MAFCTDRLEAPYSAISTACVGSASPGFSPPEEIRSRRVSAMTSNVSSTVLPAGLRPRRPTVTAGHPPSLRHYHRNPARPKQKTGATVRASPPVTEIAHAAGLTQRTLRHHATLSYAKVAEYQKRGQIHFHTVIRIDGPTGPASTPPAWATTELLDHAIRAAAKRTRVQHQHPSEAGTADGSQQPEPTVFRFGRQIDVRAIRSTDFTGDGPVTDRRVAAYIAKYATKGAETTTGTLDRRLRFLAELAQHELTDHARRMIHTAWHLGVRPEHAHLRLRQWAHMLGFRGHFSTRTRHYSTTLAHLRAERTAWRSRQNDAPERADDGQSVTTRRSDCDDRSDLTAGHTDPDAGHRNGHCGEGGRRSRTDTTLGISHWQYAGTGLLPEHAHLATLLAAAPKPRPAQTARPRARRAGDRSGHSTDPLTSPVQTEASA